MHMDNIARAFAQRALKFVCLVTCVITVINSSSAVAQESSAPYSKGGFSKSFGELAGQVNRSGKLFRIEGMYSYEFGSWEQKTKNLVADKIRSAQFILQMEQGQVMGVQCTLNDIKRVVAIRNRRL